MRVAQYSKDGQLMQIYNSITEAAKATGQKVPVTSLKYVKARPRRLEGIYGGIMKRVTNEDILQINSLYFRYKNYAEVARQTGFSPSTVKKYVQPGWEPVAVENIIHFDITELPDFQEAVKIFRDIDNYGNLCTLTDYELEQIKELWKELAV